MVSHHYPEQFFRFFTISEVLSHFTKKVFGARNNQITTVSGEFFYYYYFIFFIFIFFFWISFVFIRLFSFCHAAMLFDGCKSLSFCSLTFSPNFAFCLFDCDFDRIKGISVGSSKGVLQMRFVQLITLI